MTDQKNTTEVASDLCEHFSGPLLRNIDPETVAMMAIAYDETGLLPSELALRALATLKLSDQSVQLRWATVQMVVHRAIKRLKEERQCS